MQALNTAWIRLLLFLLLGLSLAGTRACRENYYFANQSSVSGTPSVAATDGVSVDPSETPEPSEDDPDPSESPDESPDESESPDPSASISAATSATVSASIAAINVIQGGVANNQSSSNQKKGVVQLNLSNTDQTRTKLENWLGKSYSEKEVAGQAKDTDNDGYTDWLELDLNSDPKDVKSIPLLPPVTILLERIKRTDSDGDGLSNSEESEHNTNQYAADTDSDSCSDGSEVLSSSSPIDNTNLPSSDNDRDCLSTDFENSLGLDPNNNDTDKDGLRDDFELAIGSNPFKNDTDGDGILDGREVSLGSDPIKAEFQKP